MYVYIDMWYIVLIMCTYIYIYQPLRIYTILHLYNRDDVYQLYIYIFMIHVFI